MLENLQDEEQFNPVVLIKIADELFSSCNWGRVIVFLAFLTLYGKEKNQHHDAVCSLFASYATFDKLGDWMLGNGGWVNKKKTFFNTY